MGGGAVWRVSTKRNAGGGGASLLLRATASRVAASMPLRVLRVLRVLRRGPMRILCCSSITSICHRLRRLTIAPRGSALRAGRPGWNTPLAAFCSTVSCARSAYRRLSAAVCSARKPEEL
jgi:hypothetical protein